MILKLITLFVVLSFLFFGTTCLFTNYMKLEFTRYGLAKYRVTTGIAQLLSAFGLGIGYYVSPLLAFVSALGLAVLMASGYAVRLKIKDSFVKSAPALLYTLLAIYLCFQYYVLI